MLKNRNLSFASCIAIRLSLSLLSSGHTILFSDKNIMKQKLQFLKQFILTRFFISPSKSTEANNKEKQDCSKN